MWGWIVFALSLLGFLSAIRFSHKKRNSLRSYVILLLLSDEMWRDQRSKFTDWIRTTPAADAATLSMNAIDAVEGMADRLSNTSVLGAHAALWKHKQEQPATHG